MLVHRFSSRLATVLAACATGVLGGASPVDAQQPQLPDPFQLVSQLDFECRKAEGQPPAAGVFIRQLNPVLRDRLPNQQAAFGPLEEVCVPVAKNGVLPGPRALPIARWLDLACYHADAPPVEVDVKLSHLNPQLAELEAEDVTMVQLRQVCLPVRKNDSELPPAVRQIAQHFDLACYELADPTRPAETTLVLSQLNPVIRDMGIPSHVVEMQRARQLCVPVAKNNQMLPEAVSELVRYADFLKYAIVPQPAALPAIPLVLTHLNPLYAGADPFPVVLGERPRLLVPVAKDGQLPPGGAPAD